MDDEIRQYVDAVMSSMEEISLGDPDDLEEISEEDGQRISIGIVERIMELEPAVREHFSDALLTELKEEIARDDTDFGYACRNAVMEVEERWRDRA